MAVFVLDKRKKPLMPCSEKRARQLLERGRAVVHRMYPFTIRLRDRIGGEAQTLELRIDPGSKTTGLALVRVADQVNRETGEIARTSHVLWKAELSHRGAQITKRLTQRAGYRRRRRSTNLRYRAPRFSNRRRAAGWLAPSLIHRVLTTMTWARRIKALCPLASIAAEWVRFDTQLMDNAAISGVKYQQGTLAGYEVREYLLDKFGRACIYCDATGVPLQIEHIHPKARGGSNRIANLGIACGPCNTAKGAQPVEAFLVNDPSRLARIKAHLKAPLRDAAMMNAARYRLADDLGTLDIPVTTWSGGRTKFNRVRLGIDKTHANDAACVGECGAVNGIDRPVLAISATGRGLHQRTLPNASGFPRLLRPRTKTIRGFRTGDIVAADVPRGKYSGQHTGRVAVRSSGSFNIKTSAGTTQGIAAKHCRLISRNDGYGYQRSPSFLPDLKEGVS